MKSSRCLIVFVISLLELSVLSQKNSSFLNEKSQHRIVGGHEISIEKAPWIVQINHYASFHCGGSIISITKILTAAHCTVDKDAITLSVRAGTSENSFGGQLRRVKGIAEHPKFKTYTSNDNKHTTTFNENDISILFLENPLILSSRVAIISVDVRSTELLEGVEVLATGWGRTCEHCNVASRLSEVEVPIISNDRCNKMYNNVNTEIISSMFCCGLEGGGKDSCQGDSGGPITLNNRLVGIVSFGYGCARPNYPGVYTRVSHFVPWIKSFL